VLTRVSYSNSVLLVSQHELIQPEFVLTNPIVGGAARMCWETNKAEFEVPDQYRSETVA